MSLISNIWMPTQKVYPCLITERAHAICRITWPMENEIPEYTVADIERIQIAQEGSANF